MLGLAACGGGGSGTPPTTPPVNPPPGADLVFNLEFDESSGEHTTELVSGTRITINNVLSYPERVTGIDGNALRTDGYTTYLEADFNGLATLGASFEAWFALESLPADEHPPYDAQSPSAVFSQWDGSNGFTFDINTWGELTFKVNVAGVNYEIKAPDLVPVYEWNYVAAVVDDASDSIRLYVNGVEAGRRTISTAGRIEFAGTPVVVGKSHTDIFAGIARLNGLNGAFDNIRIYDGALTSDEISQNWSQGIEGASPGDVATATPSDRFAGDHLRPRSHPMPPANWSNEPHGLTNANGTYHLFSQRQPNGPFLRQMHWGHYVSDDMVNWVPQRDALYPEIEPGTTFGFDMKGIWAGDAVFHDGTIYAFYTSVNHGGSFDPGIAVATAPADDPDNWTKYGPVIDSNVVNFRDTSLWKIGSTWHMIIGAHVNGTGGLIHYSSADLLNWTHRPNFTSIPYAAMDIGSDFWEVPTFIELSGGKFVLVVNPIGDQVGRYDKPYSVRARYWTGSFAGNTFTPDYTFPKNLDLFRGHISPTAERDEDGRISAIGIVDERRSGVAQHDAGWTQTFSLAREWYLLADNETLGQRAYPGLAALRDSQTPSTIAPLSTTDVTDTGLSSRHVEFILDVDPANTATEYGFEVFANEARSEYTRVFYDAANGNIVLDKTHMSTSPSVDWPAKVVLTEYYDEAVFGVPDKFHVFVDHSIVDVFINDSAAFSFRAYPEDLDSTRVNIYAAGGDGVFTDLKYWTLKNIAGQVDFDPARIPAGPPDEPDDSSVNVSIPAGAFDQVIGDFDDAEQMVLDGWLASGVFAGPTRKDAWVGTTRPENPAAARIGARSVSTCEIDQVAGSCDPHIGTLKSPDFVVNAARTNLNFLMAGGNGLLPVGMKVYNAITMTEVASYTPNSCSPSHIDGDDDWVTIDLSAHIGETLYIEIYDSATLGCGFLSFDHFFMSATAAPRSSSIGA